MVPEKSRKGVIHRVPCIECDTVNVEETLHEERLIIITTNDMSRRTIQRVL